MSHTPIYPILMDSVAVDIFHMNPIVIDGKTIDCFVLIVDRLTGWIVAFPESKNGLTAKKIATHTTLHHCNFFGIPRVITSDKGQPFASIFWKTLCAKLGVTNAYCHARFHQGNGRPKLPEKL